MVGRHGVLGARIDEGRDEREGEEKREVEIEH
jgi:hypothetical protein